MIIGLPERKPDYALVVFIFIFVRKNDSTYF